jgi:NADH-quinone oxidoreductase subunit N
MSFLYFSEFVSFIPEFYFGFSICFFLFFFSMFSSFKFSFLMKTIINKDFCWFLSFYICFFLFFLVINNPINFGIFFFGIFSYDFVSFFGKLILLFLSLCVFVSFSFSKVSFFTFEFFLTFLISIFSIFVIFSSTDLISVYLCLELQALCFYLLASSKKLSSFSMESGLKYFIIGAFSSGFFLFGSSIIYGFLGTTNYFVIRDLFLFSPILIDNYLFIYLGCFFVLISFFFKLGVAPYHIWVPDIYEGSFSVVTLFFICVPKFTLFFCLFRFIFIYFFSFYQLIFLFSAILCFFIGAFGALAQHKIKRFIIFSSFSHIGFLMFSLSSNSLLSVQAVVLYFFVYFLIIISFFIIFINIFFKKPRSFLFLDELEGFWCENRSLSCFLLVLFFSMAGIPPFSGFFIKFYIFFSVVDSASFFLSIVAILFSIVSSFYYLYLVKKLCYGGSFDNILFRTSYFFSGFTKSQAFFLSFNLFFILFFSYFSRLLFNLSYLVSLNFFY